jgi:hypothetical protein
VRAWLTAPTHTDEERIAIDADPDVQDAQVWLREAQVYESRRERDLALRGAEDALRQVPAKVTALALKVRILLQRRWFHEAFAAFRQRLAYDRQVCRERRVAKSRATREDGRRSTLSASYLDRPETRSTRSPHTVAGRIAVLVVGSRLGGATNTSAWCDMV